MPGQQVPPNSQQPEVGNTPQVPYSLWKRETEVDSDKTVYYVLRDPEDGTRPRYVRIRQTRQRFAPGIYDTYFCIVNVESGERQYRPDLQQKL